MYQILASVMILMGQWANAAVPVVDSVTQEIPGARAKYGVSNFKMVMPGVLYRGGNTGGVNQVPMQSQSVQALCNDGFVSAVYAYGANWPGGVQTSQCTGGSLNYIMKRWDHPTEVSDVMRELYEVIQRGQGAMYVHCWYGVHASGLIVTAALQQFCGLSADEAVDYWDSNVAPTIRYPKVQAMIRAFRADPALQIPANVQARICPRVLMSGKN